MNASSKRILFHSEVVAQPELLQLVDYHELEAYRVLSRHFNCHIELIPNKNAYRVKTADIVMNGVEWELKCPVGNSRTTIKNNLNKAKVQCKNIILDTRRTSISDIRIISEVRRYVTRHNSIERLLLINKAEEVLDIKSK